MSSASRPGQRSLSSATRGASGLSSRSTPGRELRRRETVDPVGHLGDGAPRIRETLAGTVVGATFFTSDASSMGIASSICLMKAAGSRMDRGGSLRLVEALRARSRAPRRSAAGPRFPLEAWAPPFFRPGLWTRFSGLSLFSASTGTAGRHWHLARAGGRPTPPSSWPAAAPVSARESPGHRPF